MSLPDRRRSIVPARIREDDWLVDGRPVVADEVEPEETVEVDRFRCIECGDALDVFVGLAQDESIGLDAVTWRDAGFRALESVPGRPPLQVDEHGLQAITRRVSCGSCGTEQVAIAAGGEWQPQRYVIVAHGTAPAPDRGRRWTTWLAVVVLAGVVLLLVIGNLAAIRDARGERRAARDGQRLEATVVAATERGAGPGMVAQHYMRLAWRDPDRIERTVEVDGATFDRYADVERVPIRVRDGVAIVEGDHEQRNDLVAMLVIDAAILLAIAGIAFFAWRDVRFVSR